MARNPNNTTTAANKSTVKRDEQGRSETGHPDYWTGGAAKATTNARRLYTLANALVTHFDHRNLNDADIDSAKDIAAIAKDIGTLAAKLAAEVKTNPNVMHEVRGDNVKAIKLENASLKEELAALKAKFAAKK